MILNKIRFVIKDNLEDIVKGIGSLLLFLFLIVSDMKKHNQDALEVFWENYVDRSVITSLLLVFVFNVLLSTVFSYFRSKNEEKQKIITTPKEVKETLDKYPLNNIVTFNTTKLPAIILYQKKPDETVIFDIQDSKAQYQTPPIVDSNYDKLLGAHHSSTIYNNVVIRIKDVVSQDNKITLVTMRSTFFDSLVTNRALDKKLVDKKTLRDTLQPGPYLSDLQNSLLSNHLGFNIFIVTSDHKIILVKRSRKVSISKDVLGPSVAASLKAKYALNEQGIVTIDGITNAIIEEIKDELRISSDDIEFDLSNDIYYVYRELVEGGKPQFLGLAHVTRTFDEVVEKFKTEITKEDQENNVVDGRVLVALTKGELQRQLNNIAEVFQLSIEGKIYKVSPAHAASLVMAAPYIKE